ncbi:hypothetical protein PR048_011049 [Dryococelus australis]|uniref:Uncharacterized protein n=1 Tax=Dryococelus australis TaxID=614101 RepID=A0ABQ9HKI5_9NEOP|nr:hypothetical protein PR048_011049 [Dryococelus australis]
MSSVAETGFQFGGEGATFTHPPIKVGGSGALPRVSSPYIGCRPECKISLTYRLQVLLPYRRDHTDFRAGTSGRCCRLVGDLPFLHPCIPTLLHTHIIRPQLALKAIADQGVSPWSDERGNGFSQQECPTLRPLGQCKERVASALCLGDGMQIVHRSRSRGEGLSTIGLNIISVVIMTTNPQHHMCGHMHMHFHPSLLVNGAAVAERLARSPPTKADQFQSLMGSPDFRMWELCRTMPLVGGFSRGSPASPAPSFQHCSIFTSTTLISSEDLAVKSLPNLFPHSLLVNPLHLTLLLKQYPRLNIFNRIWSYFQTPALNLIPTVVRPYRTYLVP